jgi:molybdopterin-guanine dinucleotide biosynthesis protein A
MGRAKALLRLDPDGPTLVERVVAALQGIADDVMLVGHPAWAIPASMSALRVVDDAGTSAVDGVVAALAAARHDLCFVVACDMPFLDAELLSDLAAMARTGRRSVVVRDATGVHPLHAVYRRDDLPRMEACIANGQRSLGTIAQALDPIVLDIERESDNRLWSVFNVNTPADLDRAKRHLGEEEERGRT